MVLATQRVNAQNSATGTANATATIITPIAITHEGKPDLNFGKIVPSSTAGTVVITPAGAISATSGVTLFEQDNTTSAATFTVTGESDATYAITLPESINISETGGTTTMTVDNFTSNPSGTGTLAANGEQTLSVGARLNVDAGQVAGDYTGEFSVTVAYN